MDKKSIFSLIASIIIILNFNINVLADVALEDAQTEISDTEEAMQLVTSDEYYSKFKGQNIALNIYNWGEYISDGSDESLAVNRAFEELTGIKVYYSTYATNEELYSKLRSGGAKYDIIIPSDYMISRMIDEQMLEPINFDNIPNYSFIDANFKSPSYDKENKFSVPYTWGIVGIIYNKQFVSEDEVTSWDILWDERFLGNILMFSNPRDAFAIAQSRLGYSLNTTSEKELKECLEILKEQKLLVQAYVMDEIFDKMLGGEAALAPYYAGDALTMVGENPDLGFAVPKEGTNIFVDAVCIPKGSTQIEAAEMYINFLAEPIVSAANGEYIGYALPSKAAVDLLDEEVSSSPIAYPSQEIVENAEYFSNMPHETNLLMDKLWTELLSTDERYSQLLIPVFLVLAIIASFIINLLRHKNKNKSKNYF